MNRKDATLIGIVVTVAILACLLGFALTSKSTVIEESYCTPQVKQICFLADSELECQLVKLTIDYIKEHKNSEINFKIKYIFVYEKEYENYYRTITSVRLLGKKEAPWEIIKRNQDISIWFDKEFNVVRVDGKNKEQK